MVPWEVSRSCGDSAALKAVHSFMDVDISIPSLDQIQYFAILVFPNVWVNSVGNNLVLESNCTLSYLSVTQSEFILAFGYHVIVLLTLKVYGSFCVILGWDPCSFVAPPAFCNMPIFLLCLLVVLISRLVSDATLCTTFLQLTSSRPYQSVGC